jgi:hypothetical protein
MIEHCRCPCWLVVLVKVKHRRHRHRRHHHHATHEGSAVGTLRPGGRSALPMQPKLGHWQTHHVGKPSRLRADQGQPVGPVLGSPYWRRDGADDMGPARPCTDPYCSRARVRVGASVCATGALRLVPRWLPISQRGRPCWRAGYGVSTFSVEPCQTVPVCVPEAGGTAFMMRPGRPCPGRMLFSCPPSLKLLRWRRRRPSRSRRCRANFRQRRRPRSQRAHG